MILTHISCVLHMYSWLERGARTADRRRETRARVCRLFHLFCTIVGSIMISVQISKREVHSVHYYFHVGLKESNNSTA